MSVESNTDSSNVPHPRYSESSRKCHDTQQNVTEAWVAGEYPTHNVTDNGAELYTWGGSSANHGRLRPRFGRNRFGRGDSDSDTDRQKNFRGIQHADGSGTLWHYDTREAIRTRNGLIINNQQCWCTGFARCSPPSKEARDAQLPLDALDDLLRDGDDVYDISEVRAQPEETDYGHSDTVRYRAADSVVVLNDGEYGIYIGRDGSSADYKHRHYAMMLSQAELAEIEDPSDVTDYLTPDAVAESELPVVTSTEFVRTHLDGPERDAHVDAGGRLSASQSRWRDDPINLQHFRADLQGSVIVRQGEWFFIPVDRDDVPDQGQKDARDALGNHRPSRSDGARSPLPTECEHCGESAFELDDGVDVSCQCCGSAVDRPLYVRGEVRHVDGDHDAINLGDQWHRAVTHDRDALVYRTGVPPERTGGGARGGWD